jgi:hypothetical protein
MTESSGHAGNGVDEAMPKPEFPFPMLNVDTPLWRRYGGWVLGLLVLNGGVAIAYELFRDRSMSWSALWDARSSLWSALLLFDNLLVLWWYAHRTEQQALTGQELFRIARAQLVFAQQQADLAAREWSAKMTPRYSVELAGGNWGGSNGKISVQLRFRNFGGDALRFEGFALEYGSRADPSFQSVLIGNAAPILVGPTSTQPATMAATIQQPPNPWVRVVGELTGPSGEKERFQSNTLPWGSS